MQVHLSVTSRKGQSEVDRKRGKKEDKKAKEI
jgi:hypothetical protein